MEKPRLLGGKARGSALLVPDSARPSPVRVRKALFDYLRMRFPDRGRFLDLYAGSGAVGLEAASEGFEAVLVERDAQAISLLKRNILATRLPAKLLGMDVAQFLKQAAGYGERYQVGFMAPPYRIDLLQAFECFLSMELVIPGGVAILQHPTSLVLAHGKRRVYGSNTLTILRIGGA